MGTERSTRERIVRSAARLFLTRSYQAVGVSELCDAAQVLRGSFYHYFPSKAELVKAVIDHHAAELEAALSRHRDDHDDSPVRELYGVATTIATIQTGFETRYGRVVGCPFGNLAAEVSTTDDGVREHLADVFHRWERLIARSCHRAARAGLLRGDPDQLAHAMLAQAQGAILLAKATGAPAEDITAALRELVEINLVDGATNAPA